MAKFAAARDYPLKMVSRHSGLVNGIFYAILFILYNAYWIGCISR
jgi:hypothetical protein